MLEHEPTLNFNLAGAWPVASADELVERGFLVISDQYLRWVEGECRARSEQKR